MTPHDREYWLTDVRAYADDGDRALELGSRPLFEAPALAVMTAVTGSVLRTGGANARLRCWGKQTECGHSQCHDAPYLA